MKRGGIKLRLVARGRIKLAMLRVAQLSIAGILGKTLAAALNRVWWSRYGRIAALATKWENAILTHRAIVD